MSFHSWFSGQLEDKHGIHSWVTHALGRDLEQVKRFYESSLNNIGRVELRGYDRILMISSSTHTNPLLLLKLASSGVRRTLSLVTGRQACDWSDDPANKGQTTRAGFPVQGHSSIPLIRHKEQPLVISSERWHKGDDVFQWCPGGRCALASAGNFMSRVWVPWAESSQGTAWKLQGLLKKKKRLHMALLWPDSTYLK